MSLYIYYRAQKYDLSDAGVSFANPVYVTNLSNKYPVEQQQPPSPPPQQQQQHYFPLDESEDTM